MDEREVRVGDEQRQASVEALTVHREAGRLDPTEFEDRQVAAMRARTWAEIAPLFDDLPEPHPVGMPVGRTGALSDRGTTPAMAGSIAGPAAERGAGLLGQVVPPRYRDTVMALTPFAAVLLFFLTRSWLWFLAIPVVAILLYGPDGDKKRKRRS